MLLTGIPNNLSKVVLERSQCISFRIQQDDQITTFGTNNHGGSR